jgi:hypothetical protein
LSHQQSTRFDKAGGGLWSKPFVGIQVDAILLQLEEFGGDSFVQDFGADVGSESLVRVLMRML